MSKRSSPLNRGMNSRGISIDPSFAVNVPSRIRVVDCSIEAYRTREKDFLGTLCECEGDYCCHLHRNDFNNNEDNLNAN